MSFDALAPHYRRLEWLLAGEKLQRCRLQHLDAVADAKSVLILGEGPGRLLAECRRRLPRAEITCVDASARMLELAAAHVRQAGLPTAGIWFLNADALTWEPPAAAFDLLFTPFFLDCFRPGQLAQLVRRLARSTTADARWLVAEFQVPPRGPARWRALVSLWLAYRFFRLTTGLSARRLPDPDPFLVAAGFRLQARRETDWGLLRSDLWIKRPGG